ncbi:MAG: putative ribosome biogenesis GTPase RsgA [Cognaticolwellia sp.]|jgi:putative ribosome biogenesis GTPase RsgA
MIVGTFLQDYKTYQGINYIPITNEDSFCRLVGNSGIGKSSVLESLDTFFNNKPWNFDTVTKKSGKSATKPQIVSVMLIEKQCSKGIY